MIDLEFETKEQADALFAALCTLWSRVDGQVMRDPRARIAEVVEAKEFST